MTAILTDPAIGDEERRARLFGGDLILLSPRPSVLALCEFARELIHEAFGSRDPLTAQDELPVVGYVAILAGLKPNFINHPESKRLLRAILEDLGCELDSTYLDVPRMRTSTHSDYLTSGLAYAFHPHRDAWYSAPLAQVNWWIPIFEMAENNGLAFHPQYWERAVANGSAGYDYELWTQTGRKSASEQAGTDTRVQPHPEEPLDLEPDLRPIVPPGGVILFAGAQLHSSVPNTSDVTRFSIDFRSVSAADVEAERGARNVDSHCTSTAFVDFLRASDLTPAPKELIARLSVPRKTQVAVG